MTWRHAYALTALGDLLLVAEGSALRGVYFPEHRYPPRADQIGPEVSLADDALLRQAAQELREYLRGERTTFDVPRRTAGDDLSERVWTLLVDIPYGETRTYGQLAATLGNRGLAQRVGQAVGHNPLSIIVPCHRIVGADGTLTGFAGGLERKRRLLELEEPEERRAERLF